MNKTVVVIDDEPSVQEVVERAGVTKGAMYHYFRSKDDLLFGIYERMLSLQKEHLDEIVGRIPAGRIGEPRELLGDVLEDRVGADIAAGLDITHVHDQARLGIGVDRVDERGELRPRHVAVRQVADHGDVERGAGLVDIGRTVGGQGRPAQAGGGGGGLVAGGKQGQSPESKQASRRGRSAAGVRPWSSPAMAVTLVNDGPVTLIVESPPKPVTNIPSENAG